MRIATFFMAILVIMLAFSATDAMAKDEIYRWVDENGVVHFADRPGSQTDAKKFDVYLSQNDIKPSTASESTEPDQPSYAQQQRDERAENRQQAAQRQQELDEACEKRRQLVARLEPKPAVLVMHDDGTTTRMDDDDRLAKLAEYKAFIAENCDK